MCVVKMYRLKRFMKNAITTSALIRSVEKRSGYRSYYYLLTIQYGDLTGKIFTGVAIVASKKHKVGDFIPLMYSADNPAKYKTDFGKWVPWFLAFSLIFLGLIIWFCYWLLHLEYNTK